MEETNKEVEQELDEIIEESLNNVQIDLNVDKPYLVFDRADLIRVMNLVSKIVLTKSEVPEYNSLVFVPDVNGKTLTINSTNDLSQFATTIELTGESNEMINEPFAIPFVFLKTICTFLGSKVLIFKDGVNFYIRLANGDLLVGARKVNLDKVNFIGTIKDKIGEIKVGDLNKVLSYFLPIMSTDTVTEGRRLTISDGRVYYNSNFIFVESELNIPDLTLSLHDIEFLCSLGKYYDNATLVLSNVESSVPRFFITVDKIKYEFISTKIDKNDSFLQNTRALFKPSDIVVSRKELSSLVGLAIGLPNTTGYLNLSYSDKLYIGIETHSGNSLMNVPAVGTPTGEFTTPIDLYSSILSNVLGAFSGSDNIGLSLTEANLSLEFDNTKAMMMIGR